MAIKPILPDGGNNTDPKPAPPTPRIPTIDQVMHPNLNEDFNREKKIAHATSILMGGDSIGGGGSGGGSGGGGSKATIANLAAQLSDRAKQLGLNLSDKEVLDLAKQAVRNKWDSTVITDKLLISVDWNKVTAGDLTAGAELIRGKGREYMVPISFDQARDLSLRIAKGELTQDGVESMLRMQARSRYVWMAPLIDTGVKPGDYFAPIQNVIAQTLEITPDAVDLLDPKWMGMVEVRDTKTGTTRAATLNEAMLAARARPEWSKTKQAQDTMAATASKLANVFGRN